MLDPATPPMKLLERYGPNRSGDAPVISQEQALAYVHGLARTRYENFSVLTSLVPPGLRDHFAAVYAFCRWSDDLGDETGADEAARARSEELLAWWRGELDALAWHDRAVHPVFIALRPTFRRFGFGSGSMPEEAGTRPDRSGVDAAASGAKPFHDLIDAFVHDQRVRRYETWEQVLDYCSRSANPVGRIVLTLGGYPLNETNTERHRLSDLTCTALQLINFWQDVRRDLLERGRVYIPSRTTGVTAEMLNEWLDRGDDPAARVPYIKALRPLVEKTEAMFREGAALTGLVDRSIAPVIWLFGAGGMATVRAVRRIGCATLWQRPALSKGTKLRLVATAWARAKLVAPAKRGRAA